MSMNLQVNRWFGWVGEAGMLERCGLAGPRIATCADWKREFLGLRRRRFARKPRPRGGVLLSLCRILHARKRSGPKERPRSFLGAMRSVYGVEQGKRHAVPYADGRVEGFLPAYRFTPPRAKGTIVFFGGFDSYIEELTSAFIYLRDAGYDVIAFEGPDQGGALHEQGLAMTADWHKPVSAVLDYFEVERVALGELSLLGVWYYAPRLWNHEWNV